MFHRILHTLTTALLLLNLPLNAWAIDIGDKLVAISGADLNGGPNVDLGKYIGQEPVMLVFWTSWCPNCKREVPKVNELHAKYGGTQLRIIGINAAYNDTLQKARAYTKKYGVAFPNIFDGDHRLTETYRVMGVPTVFVADSAGIVRFKTFSLPDLDASAIERLMVN